MADGAASGVAAISSSSSSVALCSREERTSRGAMSVTPVIGCLHPSPACDHLRRPLQHFPSCPQLLGYPPAARLRCAGNLQLLSTLFPANGNYGVNGRCSSLLSPTTGGGSGRDVRSRR